MAPAKEILAFSARLASRAVTTLSPRDEIVYDGLQISSDEKKTLISLACYAGVYMIFRILRSLGMLEGLPVILKHPDVSASGPSVPYNSTTYA